MLGNYPAKSALQKSRRRESLNILCALALVTIFAHQAQADEPVDATDPTKIYSFIGGGLKYNEYTNGEYMWEIRATGNIGLSESDMILFEGGYGKHQGNQAPGSNA